ncbi:MAG: terminase small subunit [Aerococcus sanguinicola]
MEKIKLTAKQEKFVHSLAIAGLSQRKAYRLAYPSSEKWKDEVVDSKASNLLKNGKVLARYRELLQQSSNMILWSREAAFSEYEWLKNEAKKDIANEGVKKANSDAFLGAIDGMNQMAFKDLELADKKLKLEIQKLKDQVDPGDTQEDRLGVLLDKIAKEAEDGTD